MNSNHIGMKPHVNHGSMESLSSSSGNFSSGLTIHQYRSKLMNIIENEPIFVLIGATGSGKTTQIPQWCLQSKHSTGDPGESLVINVSCYPLSNLLLHRIYNCANLLIFHMF